MYKNYFLIFSFSIISFTCFSQNSTKSEIYSWYDNLIGIENTSLFRGIEYVEEHRMINEKHKFFEVNEFQNGKVTYNGQLFSNVPLKFNIYDDVLIVNLQQEKRNSFFQLFSDKVNDFQINDHKFKYLKSSDNTDVQGFYEVISEQGDFKIFKRHSKKRKEIRDRNVAYTEFRSANPDYIFQFEDEFFDLDNRRDLFSQFPNQKKEIKGFYRKYRKQSRDKPDIFMTNLAREMNTLLTATNSTEE